MSNKKSVWYVGIVKEDKETYVIGEIFPGLGYTSLATLKVKDGKEARLLFKDLYLQLKGIFDEK